VTARRRVEFRDQGDAIPICSTIAANGVLQLTRVGSVHASVQPCRSRGSVPASEPGSEDLPERRERRYERRRGPVHRVWHQHRHHWRRRRRLRGRRAASSHLDGAAPTRACGGVRARHPGPWQGHQAACLPARCMFFRWGLWLLSVGVGGAGQKHICAHSCSFVIVLGAHHGPLTTGLHETAECVSVCSCRSMPCGN